MTRVVSIITPYRDAEAYLAEAIASVEEQTFAGWELILVDDGSADRSRSLADGAAARDSRIRSLARPADVAAGAAAARNWGIAQSSGEFLVFLDADDRLLSDKLRTELALMEQFPAAGMTCGGAIWWHPGEQLRNWSDEVRSPGPGIYEGSLLLCRAILMQRMHVPCLCSVMLRRSKLPAGPAFEESFALYEDQTLLVKMLLSTPVYVGRHLTALYRQHPQSTSARAERTGEYRRLARHSARGDFLYWVRTVLETRGMEPAIGAALALAEAIQSGNYSRLTGAQRATLFRFALQDRVKRLLRPLRRLLRRADSGAMARYVPSSTPVSGG